jgi:hypothetical protein
MAKTWIENCTSQRVQEWAYNHYLERDVVYHKDRQEYGFPITAEIKLTTEDIKRFSPELDKAVAVIMYHHEFAHVPVDSGVKNLRKDMIFAIEMEEFAEKQAFIAINSKKELSGVMRLGIIASVVWFFIWFVVMLHSWDKHHSEAMDALIIAVLPLLLGWGIFGVIKGIEKIRR